MKAYGHSRRDKFNCRFGCCGTKSMKQLNCRKVVDRTNRKTARQRATTDCTATDNTLADSPD